ncbi:hypothetical protein JCM33374_g4676 [Metschnikowia sp. JCM 33374]|nr:hypothetical protein JCM33374_g4676 [Metschnikowia sp. JCM 33374]
MAPPIYVKGGVWTNVEDQILKAAVSKYGLTQWSRVASLLPKKTAKQAKARWNEYLNPSINRSSWSRDDDEKLLSLAKLLPNQWRSISSMMGRSATHCVERYQKLLEDAARDGDGDGGSEDEHEDVADLKLTGPGIESLPALGNAYESLPSRPDAENMEDDEREMLSEAKARLANTQGKKAKRKDRERMLEESKRVALLQKRRELKAAGINVGLTSKNKARRKEFDYNADIPHERQPKPGIYDVTHEEDANLDTLQKFQKDVNFKGLPPKETNKHSSKAREESRAKDAALSDSKRLKAQTRVAAQMVSGVDAAQQAKRRKLELPVPGAASEDDIIKQRILQKSKDLLSAQNPGAGAGSLVPTPTAHNQTNPEGKVSRKKVVGALRALLANIPKPKESLQVVVPKFDPHEETMAMRSAVDGPFSRPDQLELLKQVDEEKARMRHSLVIQKGLQIPHPESIESWNTTADERLIVEAIKTEFKSLVIFDLAQQQDSLYEGQTLGPSKAPVPIEDDLVASIEAQIEKEVEAKKSSQNARRDTTPYSPAIDSLPRSEEAITRVFDLLHSLDASANEADQRSEILEDAKASASVYEDLRRQIRENSHAICEVDIEEKVLANVMWGEETAMERRSKILHEMVEDIKAAESRVSV